MGQTVIEIAEGRAHTDASLVAERTTSDTGDPESAFAVRRALDDLIERDRIVADSRLLRFRAATDDTLLYERLASPSPSFKVSTERDSADARQAAERNMADAVLVGERRRSDIAVEVQRCEHDAFRLGLEARRQETDDQLSTERHGADTTASALGQTKHALALARTEQGRRQDVLAMVSHDLRGPLSVISMNADNISKMTRENDTRTNAQTIARSVARIERLTNDLLDVARIESGTLRIVTRQHDIRGLLTEVLLTYEPMFASRSISFTVETGHESLLAFFDHDRIVQVLSNLLGNAMKFTPGAGAVSLEAHRQDGHVLFEVRDTGLGIAQSALPHVFERFWQAGTTSRRGLGLGLHICQNIVQSHGGRIWAESELGKGSTFRFTLPLR